MQQEQFRFLYTLQFTKQNMKYFANTSLKRREHYKQLNAMYN
jgi:hypothetical protein